MEPVVSSAPFMPPISGHAGQHNILLFGDLTASFLDDLRQLLHYKTNGSLRSFFDAVADALRRELDGLSAEHRRWLPQFTDLVDLMANLDGSIGRPALRSALLCIYQIGRFIVGDSYPGSGNSYVMGICTGSFAAVAVASSWTMKDLVTTGTDAAIVAFRTGWRSLILQRDIEVSFKPWSLVASLSSQGAQKLLQTFHDETVSCFLLARGSPSSTLTKYSQQLPSSSHAYISAVGPSTVTISGPPSTLARFVDLAALKVRFIDIYTPYHGSHLTGAVEVEGILGDLCMSRENDFNLRVPLILASRGEPVQHDSFRGLLRRAIDDVLCQQIRWDKVCEGLPALIQQRLACESCVIYPVASDVASVVASCIQKKTDVKVTISSTLNAETERWQARPAPGKFQDSKIAIIGYSGRYPEAASNEELWEEVLMTARNCCREIPADRFDWEAHYDPSGKKKNHSRVKYGCFINEPGVFDARFFNLSAREAENTDPAQRLLLMSTYEAMEMAGMVPDRTASTQRDRVGVFMGTTSDDWREVNSGQNIDTYFIPGGNRAFVPGRISYFFRFSGPAISVDTACSSSFAAISTACGYLWQGDCDTAIAGGTNVLTNPDNFVGLDRGHFLSTTGNCNPFDNSASGYCRADAVGSVILKRLDDAIADKDPIFAVIAGSSTNHCGQTASITRPHEGDQLSLFKRILRHSNVVPAEVGYVEMHGTGTQAGDAAEMRSVLSAFAPDHGRKLPLYLGAVKANVGHAESASGVTALIKVLMMMQHSTIPPHRLDGELNRNYPHDLAERKVGIAFTPTPWRREDAPGQTRRAFLNNFSAAGGNTAVLLEDAPLLAEGKEGALGSGSGRRREMKDNDDELRSVWPVAVTAKTAKSLRSNLVALASHLEQHPDTHLSALSYTTTARRSHYNFRALVSGNNVADIVSALRHRAGEGVGDAAAVSITAVKPNPPPIAFAFTGQGTLYSGIGKTLFDSLPSFRADILTFARIAEQQAFPAVLPLITGDLDHVDGATVDPVVAQLAVVCVQMALTRLWTSWIGQPATVTGHSLGEYAALYAAGVLSASNTIYLVGTRAQLLGQLCTRSTHSMLAIKAPLVAIVDKLPGTNCTVACINSPSDVVVSGPTADIQHLAAACKSNSIESVVLDVPYAFHSSQVDPILARFASLAESIPFHAPAVPYISPLLSTVVTEPGVVNATYLSRATRECVNFPGGIEAACQAQVVDHTLPWIEIGAHPACAGMIKKYIGSHITVIPSLRRNVDTWEVLTAGCESLYHAGANINWNEFHRGFRNAQVLQLPNYVWDLKNYWIQYRNNFCLTKGDNPLPAPKETTAIEPTPLVFVSPSVQKVLQEHHSSSVSSLLVESDIHDPRLLPLFEGHQVNGVSLCPSSLYADMALTVARYLLEANGLWTDSVGLDCSDVIAEKSLIADLKNGPRFVRMSAAADWSKETVSIDIYSADVNGQKIADHGSCVVRVTAAHTWAEDWRRYAYLIRSRINSLHGAVNEGEAHKMKRGMVYKLFGSLVDYARRYQGMEEVVLDSGELEATARVRFQVPDEGFRYSACWIDSLGHIAGFIMNGNDNVHSKDHVFINHGWNRMRISQKLEYGKTYLTYNKMQLLEGMTYIGDTYILDETSSIVAIFEGVKFQGIPRRVLDHVLPPQGIRTKTQRMVKKPNRTAAPTTKSARTAKTVTTSSSSTTAAPKATATKPAAGLSKSTSIKVASLVKAIISEETHLDIAGVSGDTHFTDLGVDSLLSLSIAGRLQEELSLSVDPSAFADHPTVDAFAKFVSDGFEHSPDDNEPLSAHSSGSETPRSTKSGSDSYETDVTSVLPPEETDVMTVIRDVIAQETGASVDDLSPSLDLSGLGIDSLLSLTILGVLGEVLDTKLPANLFADNRTLSEIENTLSMCGYLPAKYNNPAEPAAPPLNLPLSLGAREVLTIPTVVPEDIGPRATSVLLQGSPKKASKTLFLFPDGSGSAASYTAIPSINADVAVYGLNCPWLKTPGDLKCSMELYAAKFVAEIRRRQSTGPYHLGGWSAGGIIAFEAAKQLDSADESIASLVLIDSPNPIGLENPPARMYDFFDSQGLFGEGGRAPPSWLRPHFTAFLAMLDAYKIKPFRNGKSLNTHIAYARDGLCKYPNDPRPKPRPDDSREMLWLLNNRTDFTADGWAQLVGRKSISVQVMDEVNHFTMVGPGPRIERLAAFIAKAVS